MNIRWIRQWLPKHQKDKWPEHLKTGAKGEKLARDYLKKQTRLRLLKQNWRKGKYEIDLIMQDEAVLVFVEVRTRAIQSKVPGYATLSQSKKQHLQKAGQYYLKALKQKPRTYRWDVVEVRHGDGEPEIHHFKNAL